MADLLNRTRYVHPPVYPVLIGQFAGTDIPHPHIPDRHTGTSCMACFGWCTDARHAFHPALPVGGAR
jgi:hypothetical protein